MSLMKTNMDSFMAQMGSFMATRCSTSSACYDPTVIHCCASFGSLSNPTPVPAPISHPQGAIEDPPILPMPATLDNYKIPRVHSTSTLNLSRLDDTESQSDLVIPDDLARTEVRQHWLTHVQVQEIKDAFVDRGQRIG